MVCHPEHFGGSIVSGVDDSRMKGSRWRGYFIPLAPVSPDTRYCIYLGHETRTASIPFGTLGEPWPVGSWRAELLGGMGVRLRRGCAGAGGGGGVSLALGARKTRRPVLPQTRAPVKGFNGAALWGRGKHHQHRRTGSTRQCFNGAALWGRGKRLTPRRSTGSPPGFNGAALWGRGKRSARAPPRSRHPASMGPRFGGAENEQRGDMKPTAKPASMGPRFGGAENYRREGRLRRTHRFNGAALWGRGKRQ